MSGRIRRDGCQNCSEGCAGFVATQGTGRICLCGHHASRHLPHYRDRYVGQPEKGGCSRTNCCGFGSPEATWAVNTPCDGCGLGWLQHEFASSPVKPRQQWTTGPLLTEQNPISNNGGSRPGSSYSRPLIEELFLSEDESEEEDAAIPDPRHVFSSIGDYLPDPPARSSSIKPKISRKEAYTIAVAKKRKLGVPSGEGSSKPSRGKSTALAIPSDDEHRGKNKFLDSEPKALRVTILLLPFQGSMKAQSDKKSLLSQFRLWVLRFREGYEHLRRYKLAVDCAITHSLKGLELWQYFDRQIRRHVDEASLKILKRDQLGGDQLGSTSTFDLHQAPWKFLKIGKLTTGGYIVKSSDQLLHQENFNTKELLKLSAALDKDLKARLPQEERPDILLAAGFTYGSPSGRIPGTEDDRIIHTGPCFSTHFFSGFMNDHDPQGQPEECDCKASEAKTRRKFIAESSEESDSGVKKNPIRIDSSDSDTHQRLTRPQQKMTRTVVQGRPLVNDKHSSSACTTESEDGEKARRQPMGKPRAGNPFARGTPKTRPMKEPAQNLGPRPTYPSSSSRYPTLVALHQRNPSSSHSVSNLPRIGKGTGDNDALLSTRGQLGAAPTTPRQPSPVQLGEVLLEPPPIDDFVVRQFVREAEEVASRRFGGRPMVLTGPTALACAKTLLNFFKEHARCHYSGGMEPNPGAWEEPEGAMLGPEGLVPIDMFQPIRTIRVGSGVGPGPAREVASMLIQEACNEQGVTRASVIPALLNLNLSIMVGQSNVERKTRFTVLGLCAAWFIFVTSCAPLPLSSLELMVALQGSQSLLNEELMMMCAPEVHRIFFPAWNCPRIGPNFPITSEHPLGKLITLRLSEEPTIFENQRSQELHDEIGAVLLAKMTNGNTDGRYGDRPLHPDFDAFRMGLYVELGADSLRAAWPSDPTGAANLVCAITPMPGHGAIEVNARLLTRTSGSAAALPIEESFLTSLKYYLLSGPGHPIHPLFASFREDSEYEAMQRDDTYRARCLLQQMTGLDVIPYGCIEKLNVTFQNHLDDGADQPGRDVIRFSACAREMVVFVTPALREMVENEVADPYTNLALWLHAQIATPKVGGKPGRIRAGGGPAYNLI